MRRAETRRGGSRPLPVFCRFGAMISIANLGKSFGDRTLFSGVSVQLNRGERYGLVGANGSGKTTLLNVLCGHVDATEGHVAIPKDVRLGVLR
jgi:ATPase subunit of ABC transporter with duplicated ATPase domains